MSVGGGIVEEDAVRALSRTLDSSTCLAQTSSAVRITTGFVGGALEVQEAASGGVRGRAIGGGGPDHAGMLPVPGVSAFGKGGTGSATYFFLFNFPTAGGAVNTGS